LVGSTENFSDRESHRSAHSGQSPNQPFLGRKAYLVRENSQHFAFNENDAAADHSERARGAWRKIQHAMAPEWTTIIDSHSDGSAGFGIGDADAGAERERTMRRCQAVAVRWVIGAKS
jgi:hypothetical protein